MAKGKNKTPKLKQNETPWEAIKLKEAEMKRLGETVVGAGRGVERGRGPESAGAPQPALTGKRPDTREMRRARAGR